MLRALCLWALSSEGRSACLLCEEGCGVWSWEAELRQGFLTSINVFMASEDLAIPEVVWLCDQFVPWEIPSLGQGLRCIGMEKPTTDQACRNYCI